MVVCEQVGSRFEVGKGENLRVVAVESRYFPFWEDAGAFPALITDLVWARLSQPHRIAVTMTAELADCFPTKKEGVGFVLHAIENLDPSTLVLLNTGNLVTIEEGLTSPRRVAAANWMAPALLLGLSQTDCLFIDSGSTTTDIIPISGGRPLAKDPSDKGRLSNHQLVYTGALRTNVATVVDHVVLKDETIGIASENFSNMADVNLLLGLITEKDYAVPTSDGGEISLEGARRRLSRIICSDAEEVTMDEAIDMAKFIQGVQVSKVSEHVKSLITRYNFESTIPCVVAGIGHSVLAKPAARKAGLSNIIPFQQFIERKLRTSLGSKRLDVSAHAPAASLSILLSLGKVSCGL